MKRDIKFTKLDLIILSIFFISVYYFFYKINNSMHYNWKWGQIFQYFFKEINGKIVPNVIMIGVINTLKISIYSIIVSTFIGFVFGIMKASKNTFFRLISISYVEIIRNIPSIVVIFVVYFFLGDIFIKIFNIEQILDFFYNKYPDFFNLMLVERGRASVFIIGILALSLYESAYISEIVKGAILAIKKEQIDSAKSLGMNKWQRLRYIILPQAMPLIIPPLTGQMVSTIKDSAILSVISIPELTFQGMELMASTYLIFEIWIIITVIYLVINTILSHFSSILENKMAIK
ncbi:amino acid ABC transporter permease [Deferribacter thermophilus]|uniref:amino acid ABC transporter permease n=1 Tax=Deferribacter thermophilus TaxID=53573 RepID=UPI003C234B48